MLCSFFSCSVWILTVRQMWHSLTSSSDWLSPESCESSLSFPEHRHHHHTCPEKQKRGKVMDVTSWKQQLFTLAPPLGQRLHCSISHDKKIKEAFLYYYVHITGLWMFYSVRSSPFMLIVQVCQWHISSSGNDNMICVTFTSHSFLKKCCCEIFLPVWLEQKFLYKCPTNLTLPRVFINLCLRLCYCSPLCLCLPDCEEQTLMTHQL